MIVKLSLAILGTYAYNYLNTLDERTLKNKFASIMISTGLNITYKEIRYGRKVGAIEFNISQKTLTSEKLDDDIDVVDASQVEEMEKRVGCKLTAGTVATLTNLAIDAIRQYKINMSFYQYIEYEMDRVREYGKITSIKDVVSCLKSALRENWGEQISIPKNSEFNNFPSREYDYDKLEAGLLGYEEVSIGDVTK